MQDKAAEAAEEAKAAGELQEGMQAAQAEAAAPQDEALQEHAAPGAEEEGAMDALLALLQGKDPNQEELPAEDALDEEEAGMAGLAALLLQQGGAQKENAAQMQQESAVAQAGQEGAALQAQDILQQGGVSQEGEQQAGSKMEAAFGQALQAENENTLSGSAAKAVDTMSQAAQQNREQNMTETAAQGSPLQAFNQGPQQTVADLTAADGAPLPQAEARQVLQNSIFEQVQSAVSTGKQELFIQLKPESLGGLVIQLTMTEEGLKAQVRTGSENIQNMINTQISQLEEALRTRDIPIVQMDVIYDQAANNNFLSQQRQAFQEQRGGRGRGAQVMGIEETAGLYEAALAAAPAELGLGESDGVIYSA